MKAIEKPIDFDDRIFSQRAHQIYNRIKSDLEQKYKGKILAVEPDSGDYFIGESKMEAAMQAKVKDVRLNKLTISEFTIIANNDNLKLNCVS